MVQVRGVHDEGSLALDRCVGGSFKTTVCLRDSSRGSNRSFSFAL